MQHRNFSSQRLDMILIHKEHAQQTHSFLQNPDLYTYLPKDPPTLLAVEKQYRFWEDRSSPDGSEYWLNWVVFYKKICIGTLQAGVQRSTKVASIAYMISTAYQGQGFATEAVAAMIEHIRCDYRVKLIKAWIDTRNLPSIRLVERLGLERVERIEKADHFKGQDSDEFVYQKELEEGA